jgi:periplasmic divalent cation tolerance protein
MLEASRYFIVQTTVDTRERADAMAAMMVTEGIAACVHILPVSSVYRWKGKIETSEELRVEAKTRASHVGDLMEFIRNAHPYDTPEIIVTPIVNGDARYLEWLETDTTQTDGE